MKKLLYLLIIFLFAGCSELSNTPTKQVESYFKNYQALDDVVIEELDKVTLKEEGLTTEQKDKYKDIMKKQYQNLVYEIKDETINGDSAVVTAEIEVIDLKKAMDESDEYLKNNATEFTDASSYNDYKLDKLKNAKEKVKYTLYLSLTKVNDKWTLNTINDSIYEKINGIYNY